MRQYQVPQFIMIEDRIIGPLTLKQFLYLLGAGAIGLLGWFFLHIVLFALIAVPLASFFAALAFGKVNGVPLPTVAFSAIGYWLKPRLYLWRQKLEPKGKKREATLRAADQALLAHLPKLSRSKLDDLAWSLDIKERISE